MRRELSFENRDPDAKIHVLPRRCDLATAKRIFRSIPGLTAGQPQEYFAALCDSGVEAAEL